MKKRRPARSVHVVALAHKKQNNTALHGQGVRSSRHAAEAAAQILGPVHGDLLATANRAEKAP